MLPPPVTSSKVKENVAFWPHAVGDGGMTETSVSLGSILTDIVSVLLV